MSPLARVGSERGRRGGQRRCMSCFLPQRHQEYLKMLSEREEALGTCWALGGEGGGCPWSGSLGWVVRVGAGMLARCPTAAARSCPVLSPGQSGQ